MITTKFKKSPQTLCGLDEVGRGALAGPLVAAGVIIMGNHQQLLETSPVPIRDSKQLTPNQRQKLINYLNLKPPRGWDTFKITNMDPSPDVNKLITYALSIIPISDINQNGISWANRQVFIQIIEQLSADKYIIDGNIKIHPSQLKTKNYQLTTVIKADTQILEVMLASIIAKHHRDQLMHQLHQHHPHYHWHTNAGYGTQQHIHALIEHGPCPYHRTQFVTTALNHYRYKQNQQTLTKN